MPFPLPPPEDVDIQIGTLAAKKIDSNKFSSDDRDSFLNSVMNDLRVPERWSLPRTNFICITHTPEGRKLARFNADKCRIFCLVDYSDRGKKATIYIGDVAFSHSKKERDTCAERVLQMDLDEFEQYGDGEEIVDVNKSDLPKWYPGEFVHLSEKLRSEVDYKRLLKWAADEGDIRLELTPEQGDIIFRNSPILINGQAGTGKSTMIAYRIAIMLDLHYLDYQCQECFEWDEGKRKSDECPECNNSRISKDQKAKVAKGRRILMTCYSKSLVEKISKWTEKVLNNLDFIKFSEAEKSGSRREIPIEQAPVDFLPFPELAKSFLSRNRKGPNGRDIPGQTEYYSSDLNRVSFARFNREFYVPWRRGSPGTSPPAEYVWHSIRTFIKGMGGDKSKYLTIEDREEHPEIRGQYTEERWREMIGVGKKYREYLIMNHLWDDLDLALAALRSINNDEHRYCKECSGFSQKAVGKGPWEKECKLCDDECKIERPKHSHFNEIYLDEAQDLTRVEFDFLTKLIHPEPNVAVIRGEQPLVFAGDPNQTVNPTGFNWKHIVRLIFKEKAAEVNQLVTNHRSHACIVALSNNIQRMRREYLRPIDADSVTCKECEGDGSDDGETCPECRGARKVSINLQDSPDKKKVKPMKHIPTAYRLLSDGDNSGISNFIDDVITHSLDVRFLITQEDLHETITFLIEDPLFGNIIKKTHGNILEDILEEASKSRPGKVKLNDKDTEPDLALAFILEKYNITSIPSIKGHEHDAVVIYNFSSDEDFVKWIPHTLEKMEYDEFDYIALMFHLNRLYISTTRPVNHLIIIDQRGELWLDKSFTEKSWFMVCEKCGKGTNHLANEEHRNAFVCTICGEIKEELEFADEKLPIIDGSDWENQAMLSLHRVIVAKSGRPAYEIGMIFFEAGINENDMQKLYRAKSKFTDSTEPLARQRISEIDARVAVNDGDWQTAGECWREVVGHTKDAAECFEKAEDYPNAANSWKMAMDNAALDSDGRRSFEANFHKNAIRDPTTVPIEKKKIHLEFYKFASSDENRKFVDRSDLLRLARGLDTIQEYSEAFKVRTDLINAVQTAIDKYMELEKYEDVRKFLDSRRLTKDYKKEYVLCLNKQADKHLANKDWLPAAKTYSKMGDHEDGEIKSKNYFDDAGDCYVQLALGGVQGNWKNAEKQYSQGRHSSRGSHVFICRSESSTRTFPRIDNLAKAIENFNNIREVLRDSHSIDNMHETIIKLGDDTTTLYKMPDALKHVVNSFVHVGNPGAAERLLKNAFRAKSLKDPKIVHGFYAEFLIGQGGRDEEVVEHYMQAEAWNKAQKHAKKHGITLDNKVIARVKAGQLNKQYEESKTKETSMKLDEMNLWKEAGHVKMAGECLDEAISNESELSTQIDLRLSNDDDCHRAVRRSIALIRKGTGTLSELKIQVLEYMLDKERSEELNIKSIAQKQRDVVDRWTRESPIENHFSEPMDYGRMLEMLGDPLRIVPYYDKVEPTTKWSVEGCLRWIDEYLEVRQKEADTKDADVQLIVEAYKVKREDWIRMLESGKFDTESSVGTKETDEAELRAELSNLTVKQLQEQLRVLAESPTGKKQDLIDRLIEAAKRKAEEEQDD